MDQRGEKSRDQRTRREIRENLSLCRKELVKDPYPLQPRESRSKENQRMRFLYSLSALLFLAAAYTTNYFCPGTSLHSVTPPPTLPRTLYQVLTPTIIRQTTGLRYQRRGSTLTGYSVGTKVRYFTPRIYGPAPRKLTANFRELYTVARVRAPSLTSIDEFGKELMIPPSLQPVPPVGRDIAERIPLPASTGSPLDPTENEVIRRRDSARRSGGTPGPSREQT